MPLLQPATLFASLRAAAQEQDCFFCGTSAPGPVCPACRQDLPPAPDPACPRCALPSPSGNVCGRCLLHPPAFDATVAACLYRSPLDRALQAYKYRGALGLTGLLSGLLDQAIGSAAAVDLVVPMPLTKTRLSERGFNQALELARPLARRRRLALDATAARRVRDTAPQTGLPLDERARNVRNAFACDRALTGLAIAVVDDVMTTGTTLNELAATLKAAGAAHVCNWVIARTPPPDG